MRVSSKRGAESWGGGLDRKKYIGRFCTLYQKSNDIIEVIDGYEKFRTCAVKDREDYDRLQMELTMHRFAFSQEAWKKFVYDSFCEIVRNCPREGIQERKQRKQLIDTIVSVLLDAEEEVSENWMHASDERIKFALLRVMLDVICAYANGMQKIWYSAMIYDMLCTMNAADESFCSFYGKQAEKIVVEHTLDILCISVSMDKHKLGRWIIESKRGLDVGFVKIFCQLLQVQLQENMYDELHIKARGRKRRMAVAIVLVAAIAFAILYIIVSNAASGRKMANQIHYFEMQNRELKLDNRELENQLYALKNRNGSYKERL